MDTVFIDGLQVPTIIGVYEWERKAPQTLLLSLELGWNNKVPAKTDDIALALDYEKVSEAICTYAEQQHFELLETLAESLAELIMENFKVPWLKITLIKPDMLPNAERVGICIERGYRS